VVSLRLSEVYGPGRTLRGVVQDILDAAVEGRRLRLETGGDHPCHPLHVDDAARAVVAALDAPTSAGDVFVVAGGERVPLSQVVALVRDRIPAADIELGPGMLPTYDRQGAVDITAADRRLGYRPRWGLARGIDDYCAWREASAALEQRRRFAA
jgi:nucleoside-diphosphate-sugar epimerase